MSREWSDDGPDEHGGKRPHRPRQGGRHARRESQADDLGGWSRADVVTITLLLLMLAATVAVLVVLTLGGIWCPEEVNTTG